MDLSSKFRKLLYLPWEVVVCVCYVVCMYVFVGVCICVCMSVWLVVCVRVCLSILKAIRPAYPKMEIPQTKCIFIAPAVPLFVFSNPVKLIKQNIHGREGILRNSFCPLQGEGTGIRFCLIWSAREKGRTLVPFDTGVRTGSDFHCLSLFWLQHPLFICIYKLFA